ncbi:pescadillo homolog [Nymphaea colorata]|nr:pescadillo homolog [Nymphaea colorata]XP_031503025.1 pescadillo homolog [Nymphaea colorata]
MPKHYRPPGKKKEGNAAKYITRSKAVKFLQISLSDFRRLCILKGIFPRVPKKKTEGNHKTYYHMKDILFLAHEPLLEKFREIKAYDRKVKKAVAKKNKSLADQLTKRKPTYTLDRLIKERYPTFIDALRDLDDCLTMVHLFAALPASISEHIEVKRIHNCRRLSQEWQVYISRTHSLRKTFISVKGIYYQAEIQGQNITWLTPHARQQVLTDDVDFKIMLTFLEFYETLLGFVNFKLYHSINVKYPPILDPQLEALAEELYALSRYVSASSRMATQNQIESAVSSAPEQSEASEKQLEASDSEQRLALLQNQLPRNGTGSFSHLIQDLTDEDEDDDMDRKECKTLFKNLRFFLSREVPKESLLFIIPAFGGVVSWEGEASPFNEADESITHQIVDRPTQHHMFLSREYVQPQWVYDCVNTRIILPTEGYLVGRVAPPHLSPFVDNEAEGYVPEYAQVLKQLQAAAKKQVLPMPGTDDYDPQSLLMEGVAERNEANEAAKKKEELGKLEKQYLDELKMELQGITYSAYLAKKKAETSQNDATEANQQEPSTSEANQPEPSTSQPVVETANNLEEVMMPRKKRKLLEAMKIGKQRKQAKIGLYEERKRKAKEAKKKE